MPPERPLGRPFALLLWIGGGAATFVALADSAILLLGYHGGRPTDAGYGWLANLAGLAAEADLFGSLPALFSRYYDFQHPGELGLFLGATTLLNLALGFLFAALLTPLALLGLRGKEPGRRTTLAIWLVFLSPLVLHLADEMSVPRLSGLDSPVRFWVGGGVVVLLWIALCWPVSKLERFPRMALSAGKWTTALGIIVAAAGVGIGQLAAVGAERPAADASRPNILLVSIDSLRADHLGSYGYDRPTSPALDELASEGVLFRYTVAPTSWTLPSHVTLLTSLPPHQHQVTGDFTRLRPEAVTLAEVLRDAGYDTAAFVSGPYLQAEYGHRQGFGHFDDYSAMPLNWNAHRKITSPELLTATTRWLERWDRDGRERPFFVFLHMWDVHYDYAPPSPYDTMFDPGYEGPETGENFEGSDHIHAGMPARDLEHIVALYDGEIRHTDEHLGRLFERLREMGVHDDTVVAVTSDHGDEFFEHGAKGHRKSLYDEVLLVPLIVRYPGRAPAGAVVTDQARLLDVAPTLLSLAGIRQPALFGMQDGDPADVGRDLTTMFDEEGNVAPPAAYGVLSWFLGSVRTNDWKLIVRIQGDPQPELYDLRSDAGEQTNLAAEETATLDALYGRLMAFRRTGSRQMLAESMEIDREHLKALATLGYITGQLEDAVTDLRMTSPEPGAWLEEAAATFCWEPVSGADQYYLKVGSAPDTDDIYASDQGSSTEAFVENIPLDGRDIHVRLLAKREGVWQHQDFVYRTGEKEEIEGPCEAKVSFTNLAGTGSALHVGDRYRVEVEGDPGMPVRVRADHDGDRSGHGFGTTDETGRLVIEGEMRANHVGRWRQRWIVGGKCADPEISFRVRAAGR